MKKHIALGICVLIFLIIGGCSSTMKRSGENGYGGGISGTEKDGKNVSENENITFRVLDGKEISVSRDRLMDTGRINNRWSLEETDAMIAPLKGTWTLSQKASGSFALYSVFAAVISFGISTRTGPGLPVCAILNARRIVSASL